MKSSALGKAISGVEVTNISAHGVRLLVNDHEYFLAHDDFPWFREARVADVLEVELLHQTHLRWPALDVDLSLKSIAKPGAYPLIARTAPAAAVVRETHRPYRKR